jgi:Uma2 family endonuclease
MSAVLVLPRKQFTRHDVDRLLSTGIFEGQRYELIDGDLIDKMGQNPPHAAAIGRVGRWLSSLIGFDLVRIQLPMEAGGADRERSLPEPDVAVLGELKSEHEQRHPRGDEVLLVVEVSDTTVAFDMSRKAVLYARACVPEYWVLDLVRRVLVVHRQSDGTQYKLVQIFTEGETVSMEGRSETARVQDLLPRPLESKDNSR